MGPARSAHSELPRPDRSRRRRSSRDQPAAGSERLCTRLRLRARLVGFARGRLRRVRAAPPGGDRERREPERPQLGAYELLPERSYGDHSGARGRDGDRLPALALCIVGVRRSGRVLSRHVRRALPARRRRRNGARDRERADRREALRAASAACRRVRPPMGRRRRPRIRCRSMQSPP